MNPKAIGRTVYYTLDLDAPPSEEAVARLDALNDRPIDFSDIPPQVVDETWHRPEWALALAERDSALGDRALSEWCS